MDDGGGNGGGSFKVKHGSNAAEVTDVHEAGAGVVVLLQDEKQTKESVRRYVIYCVALGHMFLLCGARPYVSIVCRSAICFYCVALGHMFYCVCVCDHM